MPKTPTLAVSSCLRPCGATPAATAANSSSNHIGWNQQHMLNCHLTLHAPTSLTPPPPAALPTSGYLGELGLEYTPVLLDMRKGEHKAPEFLAINPFGKVPTLTDGDLK
jgi:hypothetical protein